MSPVIVMLAVVATVLAVIGGQWVARGVIRYHRWAWRESRSCQWRKCSAPRPLGQRFCSAEHEAAWAEQWDRDHFY